MQHDPRDFPLQVGLVQKARRHLVVAVDGVDRYDRLALTPMPEGVDVDRLKDGIAEAEALDLDDDGPHCVVDGAVLRFERVPLGVKVAVAAPWRTLTVTGFRDDDVMLDIDGREGRFTLAGDGQTPRTPMMAAFREAFPVGTPMTFRQDPHGVVADVRHPDPLVETLSLAALGAGGVTPAHLRAIALPHARVIGATEIGIVVEDGVPRIDPEERPIPGAGIKVHCEDGLVTGSILLGRVLYDHGEVVLLDTELPDTALAALPGRRLSDLIDAGFPHRDPVITSARCAGGDTVVRYEIETVRLGACEEGVDR